jgi:hypothetical protein
MASALLPVLLLFWIAQASPADQAGARLPPGALRMSIAAPPGGLCAAERGTGVAEAAFVLHFSNRMPAPLHVRPETSYVTHIQVVRTVEEFVPSGGDTDGVSWIMPAPDGTTVAPRVLAPGDSLAIPHRLRIVLRDRGGDDIGLEPGHYFLELVGVLSVALDSGGAPGRFRPLSVVSPYVEFEVGAPATRCPSARGRGGNPVGQHVGDPLARNAPDPAIGAGGLSGPVA